MDEQTKDNLSSLFLPIINILQEQSLDRKLNFEIDFQNNELYILQELTRCSALINYIYYNGRNLFTHNNVSRVNSVFDTFLQIPDPLTVFINNFEQFFAMYIHSKYGKNNFKLYMKECEKSPVAFPISVFEDGLCIFMQYNKSELHSYVYKIVTMFYYYTGQDFYEMIRPNLYRYPRPNVFDEYNDIDMMASTSSSNNHKRKSKNALSREEKLCILNSRNYNIKKPFLMQQNQTYNDSLTATTSNFHRCILTGQANNINTRPGFLVGNGITKPIINVDISNAKEVNALPLMTCNTIGAQQTKKILQISEHLKRSCNFELETVHENFNKNNEFDNVKFNRKTYVQTNFSKTWTMHNRRQLVSMHVIYSIMNVCLQKITQSLIESKNKPNKCEKMFTCVSNDDSGIKYQSDSDDDDDNNKTSNYIPKVKQMVKLKRPTIEVSFKRACSIDKQSAFLHSISRTDEILKFSS